MTKEQQVGGKKRAKTMGKTKKRRRRRSPTTPPPPRSRPAARPREYIALMRECWADDAASRPTFDEILRRVTPLAASAREAARARAKALGGGGRKEEEEVELG